MATEHEVAKDIEEGFPGAEVVYDRGGVRIVVATTPVGPVVGVRSPFGRARVGPVPSRPSRSLDGLLLLGSYRAELDALDVRVPAALASADPLVLARATGAPVAIVKRWQAAAELLALSELSPRDVTSLALAGVDGLTDLARRSSHALTEELNRRLLVDQPVRELYTEADTSRWIEAARAYLREARSPTAGL